jgi:hypothetical protein
MNRTLSQYLAHVATAAEHAPFGTPGVWQANYFFNNSLVWAANSVATAAKAYSDEETDSNHERYKKALMRLHTTLSLYIDYTDCVACPKLELPHVQRYLGLDKEPDVTKIVESAKAAAKLAVQTALIMGRKTAGLYGVVYTNKLGEMEKQRSKRLSLLNDVYSLVHTDLDMALVDNAECERFIEDMESTLMSIARANWLHTRAQLSDDSMQMFNVEKYNRIAATHKGCEIFLNDQGITTDALVEWVGKLTAYSTKEAEQYEGTLATATAQAEDEEKAFLAQQDAEKAAAAEAKRKPRKGKSNAQVAAEKAATAAALARKAEDDAILAKKIAKAAKRTSKKAAAGAMASALTTAAATSTVQ